jgi:hypothetical protein
LHSPGPVACFSDEDDVSGNQNNCYWPLVNETTDTVSSASFLDLYLEFDDSGQISTTNYDKRYDFNFKIVHFPNMCSNIPDSPAYGVYISQLIRYARASSNYSDFLKRHLHLRNRLLDQGYAKIRLIRSLKKFIIPPKETNMLSMRNSSILITCLSE